MIQEEKFNQIEHLIFEMTTPFSQEERIELGSLCCRMAKDKNLEFQYTSHIKSLYVHNYIAIKNGSFNKKTFTFINNKIMKAIEKGEKADLVIDPSLNKTSPTNTLARIKSIKEASLNK